MTTGARLTYADMQNPLFLHPSDGPLSISVAKLQGAGDYRSWRRSIEIQLSSKRKLGFVNGTVTKNSADETQATQWDTCNDLCLEHLKILNLSSCAYSTTSPDFSGLRCIENLNLSNCKDLLEIDPSIGHLVRLVNLNLMGCMKLKCLPSSICNLTALEQLDLDGCSILQGLPNRLGNMKSLAKLRAGCTAISTVPESIECLSKLVILKLNKCKKLRYLPSTLCNLRTLEHLILCGCSNLEVLPNELGDIESLKVFYFKEY